MSTEKRRFKPRSNVRRNPIIVAAFKREVNLQTQVQRDKKKFSRKEKHKEIFDVLS